MKKKLLGILLALVMIISLLPSMTFTASAEAPKTVKIRLEGSNDFTFTVNGTSESQLQTYIYLMDAVLDLPEDIKQGRYNVLKSRTSPVHVVDDYYPLLTMMIGECCCAFEKLPVIQDLDILRNILYAGVWVRFHNRKHKEQEHDG